MCSLNAVAIAIKASLCVTLAIFFPCDVFAQKKTEGKAPPAGKVVEMPLLTVTQKRFDWTHIRTPRLEMIADIDDMDFAKTLARHIDRVMFFWENALPWMARNREVPAKLILLQELEGAVMFTGNDTGSFPHYVTMTPEQWYAIITWFPEKWGLAPRFNPAHKHLFLMDMKYDHDPIVATARHFPCRMYERQEWFEAGDYNRWRMALMFSVSDSIKGDTQSISIDFDAFSRDNTISPDPRWVYVPISEIRFPDIPISKILSPDFMDSLHATTVQLKEPKTALDGSGRIITVGRSSNLGKTDQVVHRTLLDMFYYCVFAKPEKYRAAFNRFFMWARKAPVTEAVFKECFGMDTKQMHKEIYDYYKILNKAMPSKNRGTNDWGPLIIPVYKLREGQAEEEFKVEPAGRDASARIISEVFMIAKKYDRARQTLKKAAQDMPSLLNDPQIAATWGLLEATDPDGDAKQALFFLEKAARAGIQRPELYRQFARLRLQEILRVKGADYKLNADETGLVAGPLLHATKLRQAHGATYKALASLYLRHADVPIPQEIIACVTGGCLNFADDFDLLEDTIKLLIKCNVPGKIPALLAGSAQYVFTPEDKARLQAIAGRIPKNASAP